MTTMELVTRTPTESPMAKRVELFRLKSSRPMKKS